MINNPGELIPIILLTVLITVHLTRRLTTPRAALRKITKEKNEKEKLLNKLQKLEQMRKEFVANVSHELKTPITLIKGFVETLIDNPQTPQEELSKFLKIINTHADRLDGIISDLLSLSRIEQDQEINNIEMRTNTLFQILKRAIESCLPAANTNETKLNLTCDKNLKIEANAALIEQALINLINNAIKYSPEKNIVDITAEKEGEKINITVTDQGPGIPKEHLKYIFQRFYRIDKARSRKMGGTGLGLAIVKHIAAAHKGKASVTSTVGKGSHFQITLPMTQDQNSLTNDEETTL